jgi:16S rRNA (cytosine967-C5)-methyltransferase
VNACESSGNVRKTAADILAKVDVNKAYADVLLAQARKKGVASAKDQSLLTEIVYGTLRWRGRIDSYLQRRMRRPLEQTDPFVRNLLRLTLYQIAFLDRIPDYAAVNEAVNLAKSHGGTRMGAFVNGVLRNFLRMSKAPVPSVREASTIAVAEYWSHPEWLIKLWMQYFGTDDIAALLQANNRQAPLTLRANISRTNRDTLLNSFRSQGIEASPTTWSPQGIVVKSQFAVEQLPGFKEGLFQVQGEASQLVTFVLDPQPGDNILDACAAPGGKATHIAELLKNRGRITATDISLKGVEKINENATRLGLPSIHAVQVDVTKQIPGSHEQTYDRILVDAPCSGLGTLRSHPEIKWNRGITDVARLHNLQERILARAASRLKPNGILVYSTCTLTAAENENIVGGFLGAHEEFVLEDAASYLPDNAKQLVRDKFLLALPHQHNTDGFFAARMRKVI